MNLKYHILLVVLLFILPGCEGEDDHLLPQPVVEESESVAFNRWVYGEMNHHYLWRMDLPDSVSCDYSLTESDFFKSILSKKDRFSYMTTNSSWSPSERYNSLGFEYQTYLDKHGNSAMQVLYIYDSAAYSHSNIKRGDFVELLSKDNSSVKLRKVEVIDGLFEPTQRNGEIVISLSNLSNSKSTVQLYKIFEDGVDRVGYVCYLEYGEKNEIANVIKYFNDNNITDLILDLRYNPGGYVSTCKYICNCIVTENGYNQIFQRCSYNDILSAQNIAETGSPYSFDIFDTPQHASGALLGHGIYPLKLKRLFVLTSKNTASASEATIVCLRPFIDVTIIGETTIGKGVGSYTVSNPKYRRAIQPITMRYFNANEETTPDTGLTPDYYIPNGYSTSKSELGDPDEPLLNRALSLISTSFAHLPVNSRTSFNIEHSLTPIGEPSYVTEFNNKHYNESN